MEGDSIFENVSEELRDLIQGLLEVDVNSRLTISQALNHPWFTMKPKKQIKKNPEAFDFTNFV